MDRCCQRPPATLTKGGTGSSSCLSRAKALRSCSGWGLPGRTVSRPPVRSYRTVPPLPDKSGGTLFCGTIPKVSLAGRYPAFRPMELGLSSPPANPKIHRRRDCLSHSRVYRSTAVFPCQGCLNYFKVSPKFCNKFCRQSPVCFAGSRISAIIPILRANRFTSPSGSVSSYCCIPRGTCCPSHRTGS